MGFNGRMEDHTSIMTHFSVLVDPRIDHTREHKLVDILVIALSAVICGAEHFTEMETFGKAKETWFRTFLEKPPSVGGCQAGYRRMTLSGECCRCWIQRSSKRVF